MGVITRVNDVYDEDKRVHRIVVVTRFAVRARPALNRLASRASLLTSVGQRSLVASAYDKLDIDLVWRGVGGKVLPEERYSDAKEIEFNEYTIEEASAITDMLPAYIAESIEFGEFEEPNEPGKTHKRMYVWEIPLDLD